MVPALRILARWKILSRHLRRRGRSGSAALEFAFVAPVFFALLLGIIQAGIVFFAQETLQNAVFDVGRLVRTGQNQCFTTDSNGNCQAMTQTDFRNQICDKVSALLSCTASLNGVSLLQFDVNAYPAGFAGASNSSPLVDDDLPALDTFNPGGACDVVLIRVFYKWPIEAPGLDWFLVNMANNSHLLSAATAFRNEPYTTSTGGCS
jgi:Flp pilus assembly protein TadG